MDYGSVCNLTLGGLGKASFLCWAIIKEIEQRTRRSARPPRVSFVRSFVRSFIHSEASVTNSPVLSTAEQPRTGSGAARELCTRHTVAKFYFSLSFDYKSLGCFQKQDSKNQGLPSSEQP